MIKVKFNDTIQFFTVGFTKSNNIITLTGANVPAIATGFKTFKLDGKQLGDFSNFNTVYRELDNGVQFSCDGSIWVEPTRDVTVQVVWNDAEDAEGLRPESVELAVNGEDVVLSAEDEWKKVYADVKESEEIVVEGAAAVEGYESEINGCVVTYTHEYVDPTPSLEERVNDLEEAVCELAGNMEV